MTKTSRRNLLKGAAAVTAAAALPSRAGAQGEALKFGILTPLTGAGGADGPRMLKAIEAVIEEVNQAGGVLGRKIETVVEDDQTNPEAAVRMHWKMYPQTRPQGMEETRAMLESIHVFNARFETQRVDNRDDKRFGASSTAQWNRLKAIYKEQGLIQGNVDVNEAFTNSLIDEINRFDQAAVIRQAKDYR